MKKFLNIFLAVSMFFNLGFVFSGAKASVVPLPLSYTGSFVYDPITVTDPIIVLKRLTALEYLITAHILQYPADTISGVDNSDANARC